MSDISSFRSSMENTWLTFQRYDLDGEYDGKICYGDPNKPATQMNNAEQRFAYKTVEDNFRVTTRPESHAILKYLDAKDNNNDKTDGCIEIYYLLSYATSVMAYDDFAREAFDDYNEFLEDVQK